ncbi:hypothetical protein ACFX19_037706 [Malus domestica]
MWKRTNVSTSMPRTNPKIPRAAFMMGLWLNKALNTAYPTKYPVSMVTITCKPKPLGSPHFQVARGVELLRGDDASVPHSYSLYIAHFDALRLSALLRLDPRRAVMLPH